MNPVPLFLIIVTLPLLLGGCGEKPKVEPVIEINPVEEKQEVKPEESVAETKPKPEGVNQDELERREGIMYLKGSDTPYTGKSFTLWQNGQKQFERNYKDGKQDGLQTRWYENGKKKGEANAKDGEPHGLVLQWHENGQKKFEGNFKDGKVVEGSRKFWNSKGEPVDTIEEAEAE